jgi:hypothetical protein
MPGGLGGAIALRRHQYSALIHGIDSAASAEATRLVDQMQQQIVRIILRTLLDAPFKCCHWRIA